MYKKLILIISVLLVSAWFWAVVKPWLYSHALLVLVGNWVQPLIALIILSTLLGMCFILFEQRRQRVLASFLSGLPFFAVFGFNYYYLIALGILLVIHLGAVRRIKEEIKERTKLNIRIIMRHGLPLVITPFLVMVSFSYF